MIMLKKFAVTNFRGFKDRIEWNLSHPSSYAFNQGAVKDGVVKNGIIYGPNGAGKSNFSLAIFDIENHLTQKMKKEEYYQNFAYAGRKDQPVRFEYSFALSSGSVDYDYAKNATGQLVEETLFFNGKKIFAQSPQELYVDSMFPLEERVKEDIRMNANHLSLVNFLLSSVPLPNDHFLIELRDFVNSMLWFRSLKENEYIGLETGITWIEQYIIEKELMPQFQNFLERVSEQKFSFVAPSEGDKSLLCNIDGGIVPFKQIISTGTQSLLLIFYWLTKMDKASFVFIDEFDAFYHFRLSFEVCKLLFAQNCQVFLSSHNTYLMTNDLLRPDCNFILNHNTIKSLVACTEKELRFGHNIEKLYRGGAFKL